MKHAVIVVFILTALTILSTPCRKGLTMGYPASNLFLDTNKTTVPVDFSGKEVSSEKQYATARIQRNKNKATIFFYDCNNNPVYISDGSYGTTYMFDNSGRITESFSLNKDGSVMLNHYSKIEYYNDGSVKSKSFFDINGNPIQLERGQYGILYIGETIHYTGENGKILIRSDTILRNNPVFVAIVAVAMCIFSVITIKIPHFRWVSVIPALILIFYETMTGRASANTRAILEPFWSYCYFFSKRTIRLEILNNIWLFFPFGCSLRTISSKKRIVIASFLLSVLVEVIQYFTGYGLAELDDIISNTIGGVLGFYTASCLLN